MKADSKQKSFGRYPGPISPRFTESNAGDATGFKSILVPHRRYVLNITHFGLTREVCAAVLVANWIVWPESD